MKEISLSLRMHDQTIVKALSGLSPKERKILTTLALKVYLEQMHWRGKLMDSGWEGKSVEANNKAIEDHPESGDTYASRNRKAVDLLDTNNSIKLSHMGNFKFDYDGSSYE
jgi:hypothetical protein